MNNEQSLLILLFGANGQVGWELRRSLSLLGTVIALHRNGDNNGNYAGNLEDPCAIEATIQTLKPQVVVNAAAYTAVDKAEHDYDKAYLINALAVAQIAKACKVVNALLVHYSTDYVFDGSGSIAKLETDATHPVNLYGLSKKNQTVWSISGRFGRNVYPSIKPDWMANFTKPIGLRTLVLCEMFFLWVSTVLTLISSASAISTDVFSSTICRSTSISLLVSSFFNGIRQCFGWFLYFCLETEMVCLPSCYSK